MTRDPAFHSASSSSSDRASGHRAGSRRPRRTRLPRRPHPRRPASAPPKDATGPDPAAGVSAEDAEGLPSGEPPAPFREAALFYDPPYESLLADRLARQLVRYLKPSCGLQHETVALTPRNCFRLDFLIEAGEDVRGIERAGLLLGERPEAEGAPDLYDALIVGSGAVDVLYRIDPEGLEAHLVDGLFVMSEHDPALFERPERLHARASQGPCTGALQGAEMRLSYPAPPVDVQPGALPGRPATPPDLVVRRLSAAEPSVWAEDYRRALHHFRVPESQWRDLDSLRRRTKAA